MLQDSERLYTSEGTRLCTTNADLSAAQSVLEIGWLPCVLTWSDSAWLGCGTGYLARELFQKKLLGPTCRYIGLDLRYGGVAFFVRVQGCC